jgi:hypothetical protein
MCVAVAVTATATAVAADAAAAVAASLLLRISATWLREATLLGGWAGAFGREAAHRLVFLPGWRGLRVLARAARTGAAAASAPPALLASSPDRHKKKMMRGNIPKGSQYHIIGHHFFVNRRGMTVVLQAL